jgi:hypothetical protein
VFLLLLSRRQVSRWSKQYMASVLQPRFFSHKMYSLFTCCCSGARSAAGPSSTWRQCPSPWRLCCGWSPGCSATCPKRMRHPLRLL